MFLQNFQFKNELPGLSESLGGFLSKSNCKDKADFFKEENIYFSNNLYICKQQFPIKNLIVKQKSGKSIYRTIISSETH